MAAEFDVFALFSTLGADLHAKYPRTVQPLGRGYGIHDGFVLTCEGEESVDDQGNPIIINKHPIGMLAADPAHPNFDIIYRILNRPQYDDEGKVIGDSDVGWINPSLWHFLDKDGNATGQDAIDPANPVCSCGKRAVITN